MDNCRISCQDMSDMKKVYKDLMIISLYIAPIQIHIKQFTKGLKYIDFDCESVCLSACMPEQCVGRVPCPLESYMYVIQWRTSATTATHTLKLMQWSTFVLPLVLIHPQCSFMTLLNNTFVRVFQSPIRKFLNCVIIIFLGHIKGQIKP